MYNVFLLLFACLLSHSSLSAQSIVNTNQNNFWFFGLKNCLNFGTPNKEPVRLNGSQLVSVEASSSIADENGKLLFYTDGVSVWDSTHSEMPNGYSLWGSRSGSNGVIILPNPLKKNIFYIFTTSGAEDLSLNFQLPRMGVNYSVVDMRLNNGKGDVTQKNINLYFPSTEKLAAAKNLLTNQIWLITHELNNNSFVAIKIDSSGVNSIPVISKMGVSHTNNTSNLFNVARGRLVVSPDGTRLLSAVITPDRDLSGVFELFDFDPNNGKVSNPQILDSNIFAYSGEFSSNGDLVYIKSNNSLTQYNLKFRNIEKIRKNKKVLLNGGGYYFNALLRAPNEKIYIVNEGYYYLSVINSPNKLGNDCDIKLYSLQLDSFSLVGLPTYLNSYYNGKRNDTNYLEPILTVDYPKNVCIGDSIFGKLSVNFAKRIKVLFKYKNNILIDKVINDSLYNFALPPLQDSLNLIELSVSNDTNNIYEEFTESQNLIISAKRCCSDMVENGSFNKITMPNSCYPIGYETELDFRISETKSCIDKEFTATGQINCNFEAWYGNKNFESTSRNANSKYEYFLFGDPLPNNPQKAWINKIPTKLNTKYKFTAYVRNVEKYIRDQDSNKSLTMWIGANNRYYSDTVAKFENIRYSENWREITGVFTPNYYETEFYVGVLGKSENQVSSYGFGIDDVRIEPLPNYKIILQKDTTIFEGTSVTLNTTIGTEVTTKWTPAEGLNNSNILNPIAKPKQTTMYKIEALDRFGCSYFDSILVRVVSPKIDIAKPEKVCLGDSVYLKVKINFSNNFKCYVYRNSPIRALLKEIDGIDSIANITLSPFTDYNNYLQLIVENLENEKIRDTINYYINARNCCGDVVINGDFNIITASLSPCATVDYSTDLNFRAGSIPCPNGFTSLGQMSCNGNASIGNSNFFSETHSDRGNSGLIYGDPLINTPQRAWYQKNPTRINTNYKFTAYVRNVEKIVRNNTTNGKSLNFWLGTKDNISSDTITKIENIEYNQDWLELSGFFTARENETELSVGVIGKTGDILSSYGFGIDDISLIPLPDYKIELSDSLIIDNGKDTKIDAQINTNVSITWTPQSDLDNPFKLNPSASPKKTTKYYLEAIDKYGCKFNDSIKIVVNQLKPITTLTKPEKVCLGDSVYLKVKINFSNNFKCYVYRNSPIRALLKEIDGIDSIANITLSPFTDYNNYLQLIVENLENEKIRDTINYYINARNCCGDVVINGDFNIITASLSPCATVDYSTDLNFRAGSIPCPNGFTSLGQMSCNGNASIGNSNFFSETHSDRGNSGLIYGDPLINTPQRAWYQKNPTRINTNYKFTAYVRNVEKIVRNNTTNGKSLNFWLGTKDNISSDTITKIENIEYNQDWLELSGFFTARENETELSVGVIGKTGDILSSYGFGIDDITLTPIVDYNISIANSDTVIYEGDSIKLIGIFEKSIDTKWSPTIGLSNPNSLITFAKPIIPTLYKLETTDKYGCKFSDSVFVGIKSNNKYCKPLLSIKLSDTTIELADKFCIKGSLLTQCNSLPLPDTLQVLFKIPTKLFKVISASEDYILTKSNNYNNLLIKFPAQKLTNNQTYNFDICLVSLLADTLQSDFSASEDTSQYILIENDPSFITLTMCSDKLRLVNFINLTSFDLNVMNDKVNIYLTTEERGEYEFIIIDINGHPVAFNKFITSKDYYNNEFIQSFDISQLSSGHYFLRMKSPYGVLISKSIVITK